MTHPRPTLDSRESYQQQLAEKVAATQQEFLDFFNGELNVFASPETAYRMRAEFKIWHQGEQAFYAMHEPGVKNRPFIIHEFTIGSTTIQDLMPKLLGAINESSTLKRKLFQAEFLTSSQGEALVSLIYHKPLDEQWQAAANQLASDLNVSIIGRSRKQKVVLHKDFITEELNIKGKTLRYQQVENSFTQPNARICESMLEWAIEQTRHCGGDLLELYCGNGNFSIALAEQFEKVLATEISKPSIRSALYNCDLNDVNNISFVRMSSEEFTQALEGVREFRRLKGIEIKDYNFSTILVDPPRAGMDEDTCRLCQQFDHILYISCNPETLLRDLHTLTDSHAIKQSALFDQFPYTPHRECGVFLHRR